jgi:hypothetical protein
METVMHYLKGAMPKDDDEKDESFSDQIRADKNKDPDVEELEKDPLEVKDETQESDLEAEAEAATVTASADERDEDLNEEEQTYKKRYGDVKSDRDEKVRLLRATMAENARLKTVQTTASEVNEEQLAKEIQDGIYAEVSSITEPDPAKARKAAYDVIGKHIAKATKQAVDMALKQVEVRREREMQQMTDGEQKRGVATKLAKIALKEIGLNPETDITEFQRQVDLQMETDADWFQAIPADQHFLRLAKRVQKVLKDKQQANEEHRRDAGGTITSSSRVRRPSTEKDDADGGELDTMRGAMGLATRANFARGKRAFQLANVQR